MTPFWLWVSAGCAACTVAGFSLVRVVARVLPAGSPQQREPRTVAGIAAPAPIPVAVEPPADLPAPSVPPPDLEKLELWARQINAGDRKMSVATDGCRVTWNRTCKHGHPTWLVYLGYL
jgi:hypothetical protein